ncbi:hypothetical protein IIZ77_02775 [Candidatus Saccharibacteria bacterium]|nr:hypothetical protein [Candidatus Saccharibacteria bacterium]
MRIAKRTKRKVIVGIRIFTGDDRVKISEEVTRELGEGYEVFEGENLAAADLSGIFLGATLFSVEARKILIKDLSENKEVFEEFATRVEEFLKTDAKVIIWETKIDKRLASTKALAKAGVEVKEFKMAAPVDMKAVFNIYDMAFRDGGRAVAELTKIESAQDPYMFFGLLVSQTLRKLEWKPNGVKEKRVLKELSVVDMQMKSTAVEPWMLIESFLLRVATL